jgi:disulfide bond formation protein DsbB
MATEASPSSSRTKNAPWTIASLLLSLVGTAGSLYLSLQMGLKACPLCLYQRSFLMSSLAVLVMAVVAKSTAEPLASLLALPPALAGGLIAAFHVYLEWSGKLECPAGVFAVGSAPRQSLMLFVLLVATLAAGAVSKSAGGRMPRLASAVGLGILLAIAAVASAPPMPKPPAKAYEQPLDICRPPYPPDQR